MKPPKRKPGQGFRHPDHPRPVTRRDFLAQGILAFSAGMLMPSLFDLVRLAHAAEECAAATMPSGLIPFLVIDCAGGAALMGNWVPLDKSGQLLPSYGTLGLGNPTALKTTEQFGAPMAIEAIGQTNVSKILQGILQQTSAPAQAALKMGTFCHFGQSDSRDNQLSAMQMVGKAGYQGSLIRSGLGMTNNNSGGNSDLPNYDPSLRPVRVNSVNDITGTLSYGAALKNLPASSLGALARATRKLSAGQASRLSSMSLGEQFAKAVDCGLLKNAEFAGPVTGIDPREDAVFQRIYGINAMSNAGSQAVVQASIVMNVLKGNSGPGVITLGGCDYHSGNQTDGDAKDLEIGQTIGRAVQAAVDLRTPLVIQILTDGGIYSQTGSRAWQGDSNERSMTVFAYVNPNRAPVLAKTQIGFYTSGEGAAPNSILGNNPQRVSYAVALNYLALTGRMDLASKLIPDMTLLGKIDQVLLWG